MLVVSIERIGALLDRISPDRVFGTGSPAPSQQRCLPCGMAMVSISNSSFCSCAISMTSFKRRNASQRRLDPFSLSISSSGMRAAATKHTIRVAGIHAPDRAASRDASSSQPKFPLSTALLKHRKKKAQLSSKRSKEKRLPAWQLLNPDHHRAQPRLSLSTPSNLPASPLCRGKQPTSASLPHR